MPTPITLSRCIPGDGLDRSIEQFLEAGLDDPFGTWLVLPTSRLRDTVRMELTRSGRSAVESRICTPTDLYREIAGKGCPEYRFISHAEAQVLLAGCLAGTPCLPGVSWSGEEPPRGLVREIQDLISIIIRRRTRYPGCLGELQDKKSDAVSRIMSRYHNALEDCRCMDPDTLLLNVCALLERSIPVSINTMIWYGNPFMLALETEVMYHIMEKTRDFRIIIPRTGPGEDTPGFQQGMTVGKRIEIPPSSHRIESCFLAITGENGCVPEGSVRSGHFSSRSAEFHSIAGTIAQLHDEGVPYHEIAVAHPDLKGNFMALADILSDHGIPYVVPPVIPLISSPVVRFLLDGLNLPLLGFPRDELVAWISSPYFRWPAGSGPEQGNPWPAAYEVDLLARYLGISGGREEWSRHCPVSPSAREEISQQHIPAWLVRRSGPVGDHVTRLTDLLAALDTRRAPGEHLRALMAFLDMSRIPHLDDNPLDTPLLQKETSALSLALSLLRQIPDLPFIPRGKPVPFSSFVSVYTALVREQTISAGSGTGIRVAGIREMTGLRFRYVFLAGLSEGAIPNPTTRLPLCSRQESQRMGARTLHEVIAEERFAFTAAALTATECLYISYPEADGKTPVLPSVFFESLSSASGVLSWEGAPDSHSSRSSQVAAGKAIASGDTARALDLLPDGAGIRDLAARITAEGYNRQGLCDSVYDGILQENSEIVGVLQKKFGSDKVWSASQIELYARCPFRFFVERVLFVAPLPDPDEDSAGRDAGSIVHQVLAGFYRNWTARGLGTVDPGSLETAHAELLEIARGLMDAVRMKGPRWRALELEMTGGGYDAPGILYRFLEYETGRSGSGIIPYDFESGFGMEDGPENAPAFHPVNINRSGDGIPLLLRGRIDRVDLTTDGFFTITDYKTGSSIPTLKEVNDGTALQLPLYLLAYQQLSGRCPAGGMYLGLKGRVKPGGYVVTDKSPEKTGLPSKRGTDIDEFLKRSLLDTLAHIERIRRGCFPLPLERGCRDSFCPIRPSCRFSKFRTVPETPDREVVP